MRGKLAGDAVVHSGRRIIPAHAGQTWPISIRHIKSTDHPRACGANVEKKARSGYKFGSSPRMRGKPFYPVSNFPFRRIIPAHAGQTSQLEHSAYSPADHPRACGANFSPLYLVYHLDGSSPRMRGKRGLGKTYGGKKRIIPAHAGQTMAGAEILTSTKDHPRACGANAVACA